MRRYNKFRLYITDFRRNNNSSPENFANLSCFNIYDENMINMCTTKKATYLCSSATDDSPVSNAFDGDRNTYWHSIWWGEKAVPVNWIEIDFEESVDTYCFGIVPTRTGYNDFPVIFYIEGYYNYKWYTLAFGNHNSFSQGSEVLFYPTYLCANSSIYSFPPAQFFVDNPYIVAVRYKTGSYIRFVGSKQIMYRDPIHENENTPVSLTSKLKIFENYDMNGIANESAKYTSDLYFASYSVVWNNYNIPQGADSSDIFIPKRKGNLLYEYLYSNIVRIFSIDNYTTDRTVNLGKCNTSSYNIILCVVSRDNVETPDGFELINNPDYGMNKNQKMYLFVNTRPSTNQEIILRKDGDNFIEAFGYVLKDCSIKYNGNHIYKTSGVDITSYININKIFTNIVFIRFASSDFDNFDLTSPGISYASNDRSFYSFDYNIGSTPHLLTAYDNYSNVNNTIYQSTFITEPNNLVCDGIEIIPNNRGELVSASSVSNSIIINSDNVYYDVDGRIIEYIDGKDTLDILRHYTISGNVVKPGFIETLNNPTVYYYTWDNSILKGRMEAIPKSKYIYSQSKLLLGNNITIQEVNIDASDDVMFAFNFGEDDKGYVYNFITEQWEETDSGVTKDVIETYINCPIFDGKWKYRIRVMLTESGYFRSFLLKYQNTNTGE